MIRDKGTDSSADGSVLFMKVIALFSYLALAALISGCQSSAQVSNSAPVYSPSPRSTETLPVATPAATRSPVSTGIESQPSEPGPQSVIDEIISEAEALLRQGRWQEAVAVAEQGLRIDRRQAAFYTLLGESYLALGDRVQAQRFANQASRLCREDCLAAERLQQRLR